MSVSIYQPHTKTVLTNLRPPTLALHMCAAAETPPDRRTTRSHTAGGTLDRAFCVRSVCGPFAALLQLFCGLFAFVVCAPDL